MKLQIVFALALCLACEPALAQPSFPPPPPPLPGWNDAGDCYGERCDAEWHDDYDRLNGWIDDGDYSREVRSEYRGPPDRWEDPRRERPEIRFGGREENDRYDCAYSERDRRGPGDRQSRRGDLPERPSGLRGGPARNRGNIIGGRDRRDRQECARSERSERFGRGDRQSRRSDLRELLSGSRKGVSPNRGPFSGKSGLGRPRR